ncbi:MAG: ParB N-terminal domain-containing protein [Beijerinckiaceae bacterium]
MAKRIEKPKRPVKLKGVKRLKSRVTLEQLKELAKERGTKKRPIGLHLKEIHTAPTVFQWRLANEEIVADEQHVRELARIIRSKKTPQPLDAILVTPIGSRFFVVDGHHRLDAYHTAGWKGPVPVVYLETSLEDARVEALRRNIKNQLPMTRGSKSEAAWRLMVVRFKDPTKTLSWQQIADLTTVNRSTVARMNRVLERFKEEAAKVTWREARRLDRDKDAEEHAEGPDAFWDARKEKQARILASYLAKGPSLTKDPEVTAMALHMVSGALPELLVGQWPEAIWADLEARAQDLQPEDAARVVEALDVLDNPYVRRQDGGLSDEPDAGDVPDTVRSPGPLRADEL